MAFTVGTATYLAGIETAGATTLNLSGGSGLPTGAGGGGGSGGGGSNASVGATGSAVPGSATLGGMSVAGTMTALPGTSNGLKVDGSAVTQPVSASALPLPTGAATAANQTNANQKTQIVDGSGNVIASTSNNLNVQCANCSGSGASADDEATMTPGSSVFAPQGGFFQNIPTNNPLTNLQQGLAQLTANRAVHMNLRNATGTEIGTASSPLQVSLANTGSNSTAITVTNPTAGSTGATAPTSAALIGGRAQNAEAAPVTNGQMTGAAMGLEGKLIMLPFANKENMVRGTASQTGTSATTLIAAQGPGIKIYVTGVQCKNTGSATTIVTLNDNETTGSGTVLIVPTSGGDNEVYQTPLAVAANTALTFTPSAARRPSTATLKDTRDRDREARSFFPLRPRRRPLRAARADARVGAAAHARSWRNHRQRGAHAADDHAATVGGVRLQYPPGRQQQWLQGQRRRRSRVNGAAIEHRQLLFRDRRRDDRRYRERFVGAGRIHSAEFGVLLRRSRSPAVYDASRLWRNFVELVEGPYRNLFHRVAAFHNDERFRIQCRRLLLDCDRRGLCARAFGDMVATRCRAVLTSPIPAANCAYAPVVQPALIPGVGAQQALSVGATSCVSNSPVSGEMTVTTTVAVAHGPIAGQTFPLSGFTGAGNTGYNATYTALAGTTGTTLVGETTTGGGTCPTNSPDTSGGLALSGVGRVVHAAGLFRYLTL